MNKQSFKESDLQFTFSEGWVVKKYDDHAYFKILSGHGLKGVDFIGIYENKQVYLIEVKNYNKRSYSPVDPDWSDIEGETIPLASAMHNKIEDSLRLIKAVNSYLSKRWWYRSASWLRTVLGNNELIKDWHFWKRVGELLETSNDVFPVLWIELSPDFLTQSKQEEQDVIIRIQNEYAFAKTLRSAPLQISTSKKSQKEEILKGVDVKFLD